MPFGDNAVHAASRSETRLALPSAGTTHASERSACGRRRGKSRLTRRIRRMPPTLPAMGNDLKNLLDLARTQGWEVSRTGGGHWRCVPPDPAAQIVVVPSTTARLDNTRADLRRSGLIL